MYIYMQLLFYCINSPPPFCCFSSRYTLSLSLILVLRACGVRGHCRFGKLYSFSSSRKKIKYEKSSAILSFLVHTVMIRAPGAISARSTY